MITQEIQKNLVNAYFIIRDVPAWVTRCHEAGYSKEELEYLEKLDDEFSSYQPEKEANKWAEEIIKGGGTDIFFSDSDEEKLAFLSKQIINQWLLVKSAIEMDAPYFVIEELTYAAKGKEKIWSKTRARHIHKSQPYEQATEWEITKAREYPLEELLSADLNKFGYINCRWHDDEKPSMLVKNGFGYCFSCGEWCDSIKWLMTQESYSFVDAVKRLVE